MPVSFPLSSPTGIVLFLVCPFAWGGLGFFISTCCSVLMPFIYSVQQTALLNSPMLNIFYSTITLGLFLKLFLFFCAGYHTIALTLFLNEMNSIIISLSFSSHSTFAIFLLLASSTLLLPTSCTQFMVYNPSNMYIICCDALKIYINYTVA